MKQINLLIATLLTAFAVVSCDNENGKDDPMIGYPYSYYEPYLMWDATAEEVMQFMSSAYPSWILDSSSSSANELLYIDGKYKTVNMSYTFKDGGLESSEIIYPMQINSFDTFKSDIEDRYEVEMKWKGFNSGIDIYFGHSDVKNMDITLESADSRELLYMISARFDGTGPAPSDDIKFDITPSNKATLNYTDLLTILLTFPEAREVSFYDDFFKTETFSLVDSKGNIVWELRTTSTQVSILGNEIRINVPLYLYDKLTVEGDYSFVITPNTVLVDGKMLPEQHITYHLTAIPPVLEPFNLKFDSKVINTNELHFYIPDDIEISGWNFYGGTPIYDEGDNTVGKVKNFGQVEGKHFFLILEMTGTDPSKTYHFDVAEGLIVGSTLFGNVPSAAAKVTFVL